MSMVQDPGDEYRKNIQKGRFYRCPYAFPVDSLVLVRPIYDDNSQNIIPADIKPLNQCQDAFSHSPFPSLRLMSDEEFIIQKAKYRRVVVLSKITSNGLVNVAPVYTIKDYHHKSIDIDKLKNNQLPGLIYLEDGKSNEEGFISLMESFGIYTKLLTPIRLELNQQGIELLDENLVTIYDIYSISE